ncbi:MAG: hypothetical protein P8J85_07105 [Alphaproteobacteria bacterium]|nr:hypothetical protein [Alphaproteobacteria bacterium]
MDKARCLAPSYRPFSNTPNAQLIPMSMVSRPVLSTLLTNPMHKRYLLKTFFTFFAKEHQGQQYKNI